MKIDDKAALRLASHKFFHVAEQNYLFVLANEPCTVFAGEHTTVTSQNVELLMMDFDEQAAILYPTKGEIECKKL